VPSPFRQSQRDETQPVAKRRFVQKLTLDYREALFENVSPHRKDFKLDAAELGLSGQLLFHGVTLAQWQCHELTNDALFNTVSIQPGLVRRNQVILRVPIQSRPPGFSGNCANFAGSHFNCKRVLRLSF
jgi:hypothetical protein